MRKFLFFTIMCALLTACNKIEESGDLPGMWQLMTVTRKGNVTDMKAKKVYWCERLGLIQFTTPYGDYSNLYAHVAHVGNKLVLTDFCFPSQYVEETDDDTWITMAEREVLFAWGIYARKAETPVEKVMAEFDIEKLTADEMVLKSDSSSLMLRKF